MNTPHPASNFRLRRSTRRQRATGFTLIEVMIVVVIIGVIAAFAIPSYRDYVLRGQVVDATNGLATMQAAMERHFQDFRTYESTATATTPCEVTPESRRVMGQFTLSCDGDPDGTTYTLQAEGSGPTDGFTYKLTHQNIRSAETSVWGNCTSAWVLSRGQSC